MDGHALSQESLQEWEAVAASLGTDASRPLDRELLNRFLIGVHSRGEELSAHDLALLLDELDVQPERARELVSLIEAGLGLLEDYDRLRGAEGAVGPGILVI